MNFQDSRIEYAKCQTLPEGQRVRLILLWLAVVGQSLYGVLFLAQDIERESFSVSACV